MLHYDLLHPLFFASAVVNMQIINAAVQVRYIQLRFSCRRLFMLLQIAVRVVEAKIVARFNAGGLDGGLRRCRLGIGNFFVYFDVQNIGSGVGIDGKASWFGNNLDSTCP